MTTKHTPGPWTIGNGDDLQEGHVSIDALDHGALAQVVWKMIDDDHSPRCEANARLIAAAPELLEIAKQCAAHFVDTDAPLGSAARAAIAKATGETS